MPPSLCSTNDSSATANFQPWRRNLVESSTSSQEKKNDSSRSPHDSKADRRKSRLAPIRRLNLAGFDRVCHEMHYGAKSRAPLAITRVGLPYSTSTDPTAPISWLASATCTSSARAADVPRVSLLINQTYSQASC